MPKPVFIAEIGWNHMGDMTLARHMIKEAKLAGCDFAKFQTWSVNRLKSGSWDSDGRRSIYENAELSIDDHRLLIDYCSSQGIGFMSSVFSLKDAQLLSDLGVTTVKIPSFEIANEELHRYCDLNFDKVFTSTGTSTWSEVERLSSFYTDISKIIVMHCVSSYPCEPANINLGKIDKLKSIFPNVGFSDHTIGVNVAKIACQLDISAIEKHFTTDHELPGRDNKFAVLPSEMSELTRHQSLIDECFIDHGTDFQSIEQDSRDNYRGRFNA